MFTDYISGELGEPSYNAAMDEASWDCPFCTSRGETADTKQRFSFNEDKMVGHCFNCGWSGNAVTFVKDIRGIAWKDAIDVVNIYTEFKPLPESIFDEVYERLYIEGSTISDVKHPPRLPSDYKVLVQSQSLMKDRFIQYARSRGVSDKQLGTYMMGFCPVGIVKYSNGKETQLDNHLFILNPADNGISYWMARALTNKSIPKTFNPVADDKTLGKSDVVFNLDIAKKTGVLVITEGVFDALTIGDSGVALYGKAMHTQQYLSIIHSGVDTVYVMLDADARTNALSICERLARVIKNVYFCSMPHGDPNDIGPHGCLQVLQKAEKYSALSSIKLKLGAV